MDNREAQAANERIMTILGHHEAFGREALAHHLATRTNETLASAIDILKASGRDRGGEPVIDVSAVYRQRREATGR